eukprot:CAMPEP_0118678590 /NCGR_PEP_ID=MMETSP0800-20121206/3307_1 /TAXON_ID=210618 ORGANISM="Striatella unipunctata, Strain CCMP2910" /NCGR_SAMPLE_ID=MMETSP0800 /ASSEMBLY_ACC=CAM_ASM_000638 /LENGTH=103 /DNA_ID=CAMNT_0006574471 /DNA_START=55 /DNA_END=366 /DNA_ORIENTATION=-
MSQLWRFLQQAVIDDAPAATTEDPVVQESKGNTLPYGIVLMVLCGIILAMGLAVCYRRYKVMREEILREQTRAEANNVLGDIAMDTFDDTDDLQEAESEGVVV